MEIVMLIAGFVLLFFSGDWLVKSSVDFARRLKISTLVVGITVVSFGTSAPELIVCINAALNGQEDIAMGNVVGSNIANIALVLGMIAIVFPIIVKSTTLAFDWGIMMIASLLLFVLSLNYEIKWFEGGVLFVGLISYVVISIVRSRKKMGEGGEIIEAPILSLPQSIGLFITASIGLYYGSELLVEGASKLALNLGVSSRVIGLSVVAFGTSVPELSASIIAAFKKETDISIGNIIGSNIFNILGVLGLTSIIKKIKVTPALINFDLLWMMSIALLLLLLLLPLKKGIITRWKGALLVSIYLVYMAFLFIKKEDIKTSTATELISSEPTENK